MENKNVLIVNDHPKELEDLVRDMNQLLRNQDQLQGEAVGALSGEDAIDLVEKGPRDFQFAVVDQDLGSGMDGIETTRKLVDLRTDLYVLVYTRVPSDDPEMIAKFKYEALAAGAYRYLERGSEGQAPKEIHDFVAEMDQLRRLREWIREYYDTRANVIPSLLTQIDIAVDVIDSSFKVWYMNDAMRRLTGTPTRDLPRRPCSAWHNYEFAPCLSCLVQRTFEGGGLLNHTFLSPLPLVDQTRLLYQQVWTQPIRDESGKTLVAPNGRPLAVMESVQDLTDTDQLRQMPRDKRLRIIAGALWDCPAQGRHFDPRCFDRVRLYLRDNASQGFVLKAAEGFEDSPPLDVPVNLYASGRLAEAEGHMRTWGCGYKFPGNLGSDLLAPRESYIYWPIIEEGRTVAVLEAIGDRYKEDTVPLLKPYAEEVRSTLRDAQLESGAHGASVEAAMAQVDFKLQVVSSAAEALQLLVNESCQLTGSTMPVLRYRDGNDAVLVVLGSSGYEKVAEPRYPLSRVASWSVRTIVSGQEQFAKASDNKNEIAESRKHLREPGRAALSGMRALCFEPLFFLGRCIGSVGFHAEADDNFTKERRDILRSISNRIAPALHDYLLEERTRAQVEAAQEEIISLVLHNINNPLASLRTVIESLKDRVTQGALDKEDLARRCGSLDAQAARIGRVRGEYLKLRQPWESRIERVDLAQLLREAADEETADRSDVTVECIPSPEFTDVQVDAAALRVCLRVLLQNSLDALDCSRIGNRMRIDLRRASVEEAKAIPGPVLAIDVIDNGSGVPAEVAKGLFKVVKSTKATGLGMGLAYARHVVGIARGDVYYNPNPTTGAKFTVLLPFVTREPEKGVKGDEAGA